MIKMVMIKMVMIKQRAPHSSINLNVIFAFKFWLLGKRILEEFMQLVPSIGVGRGLLWLGRQSPWLVPVHIFSMCSLLPLQHACV
jgi:hypothetical protein